MEIRAKVVVGGKDEAVTLLPDGRYELRVKAPRSEGRANERAKELLAAYFEVPVAWVSLRKGHTQSTKLFFVREKE